MYGARQVPNEERTTTHSPKCSILNRRCMVETDSRGRSSTYVLQTIDIRKRPGQTLGIFIREGNGLDRYDGVFVSRLAENTPLAKMGVIKVGDEILAVNHVDVATTTIDDVVVLMSKSAEIVVETKFNENAGVKPTRLDLNAGPIFTLKQQQQQQQNHVAAPYKNAPNGDVAGAQAEQIETKTSQTSLGQKVAIERRQQQQRTGSTGNIHPTYSTLPSHEYFRRSGSCQSVLTPRTSYRPLDQQPTHFRTLTPPTTRRRLDYSHYNAYNHSGHCSDTGYDHESPILKPALRQNMPTVATQPHSTLPPSYHSKSLPRMQHRRSRAVKWQSDYMAASDTESAASAPAMDLGGRQYNIYTSVRPIYDTENYTSNEYRHWNETPSTSGLQNDFKNFVLSTPRHHPPPHTSYTPSRTVGPPPPRRFRSLGRTQSGSTSQATQCLSGLLSVHIEHATGMTSAGSTLSTDQLYCVVEIDSEYRARTAISTAQERYCWNERFKIHVFLATQIDFLIYSWHPRFRHGLCFRGSIHLNGEQASSALQGGHQVTVTMEPRGQLVVQLQFTPSAQLFHRTLDPTSRLFATRLPALYATLPQRHHVPNFIYRITSEIETRGLQCNGIYALSGAESKKAELKAALSLNPETAPLNVDAVPDVNVLTCVFTDFLRDLAEPLITPKVYEMLLSATELWTPTTAERTEDNSQLIAGIIDCLPSHNKYLLKHIIAHLSLVERHGAHNAMTSRRLCALFGPLLLCWSVDHRTASNSIDPRIRGSGSMDHRIGATNSMDPRLGGSASVDPRLGGSGCVDPRLGGSTSAVDLTNAVCAVRTFTMLFQAMRI